MFKLRSGLLLFSCIIAWSSTRAQSALPVWLCGTWRMQPASKNQYETWTQVNGVLLHGRSYTIRGKDTTTEETTELALKEGALWFVPTMAKQNNGQPVPFREAGNSTEHDLHFVNEAHDFPTHIRYTLVRPDSLLAEISGMIDGKERSIRFPMKKLQ